MHNKIKIGVLGCANIATRSVIPAIKKLNTIFELYGIASRDLDKANIISRNFDCLGFGSYDELVNQEAIDAIYIPLPNSLHFKWIKAALTNKKHVIVEKSMGCSLSEVSELNDLARENGLALIENFQFRTHPQLKEIKAVIESGGIGDIRQIHTRFGFPPFQDRENIRYKKSLGGGALLDAGAYPIKVTQELLGVNCSVSAAHLSYDPKLGIDLWGNGIIINKNSGICSHVSFGFDHYYQCLLEVWGSEGLISANRIFTAPAGYKPEVIVKTQSGIRTLEIEGEDHFENMLKFFYSAINTREIRQKEYVLNIDQARVIEQFFKANNVE